jgi:hypothetical protein
VAYGKEIKEPHWEVRTSWPYCCEEFLLVLWPYCCEALHWPYCGEDLHWPYCGVALAVARVCQTGKRTGRLKRLGRGR